MGSTNTLRPRRWLGWLLPLVFVAASVAAEPQAVNPHFEAALRLYDELEYEQALLSLDQARQSPSNTLQEQVSIELLDGILAFELHQPERGKGAFRRAVSLDPNARMSLRVSPKVVNALEEARAEQQRVLAEKPLVQPVPAAAPLAPPRRGSQLRLPVAIGGGVVAAGGLLAWTRARSLTNQVRSADRSITTRAHLEDRLSQGRTFQTVGWALMGLGAATTAGSLLFLEAPSAGTGAAVTPTSGGAHLSLTWRLP